MGFIADIFEAIADVIAGIFNAIQDALNWIAEELMPTLTIILGSVALAGITLGIIAPAALSAVIATVGNIITSIGSITFKFVKGAFHFVLSSVKWLGANVQNFLQAIHFKELLALHNIAMILNKDYREMMMKVYQQISEFSYEVFGSANTLHMLLQSTRTLVYSLTSSVGYPVDVAEAEWVSWLDEVLVKVSDKANVYAENPEAIFDDLAEWAYSPLGDKYATINSGFSQILISTVDAIDSVARGVFEIEKDVKDVIGYLPEPLRGTLNDEFKNVFEVIDTWQYDVYAPTIDGIYKALDVNRSERERQQGLLKGLTQRIANPVDYLTEVDEYPLFKRLREKERLKESLDEPERRSADRESAIVDEWVLEFEKSRFERIIEEPSPPPAAEEILLEPVEPEKPTPKPGWFVGDY